MIHILKSFNLTALLEKKLSKWKRVKEYLFLFWSFWNKITKSNTFFCTFIKRQVFCHYFSKVPLAFSSDVFESKFDESFFEKFIHLSECVLAYISENKKRQLN